MWDQNSGDRARWSSTPSRSAQPSPASTFWNSRGVDVHESGLEEVEGEHGDLGVLAVGAGEVAVFAVEQHGVGRVPVLDDLEAAVDLAAQLGVGQVVAGEDRAHGSAKLLEGLVGGVLGAATGEAPQDRLRLSRPEPQRGGVLDHLVVLLGDQLPADRPVQCRSSPSIIAATSEEEHDLSWL
jgi:hypothetical protein